MLAAEISLICAYDSPHERGYSLAPYQGPLESRGFSMNLKVQNWNGQ